MAAPVEVLKYASYLVSSMPSSGPPQLLLMTAAPSLAAVSCAIMRPSSMSLLVRTSTILQSGQAAETMSRSSAVSPVQSSFAGASGGIGDVLPSWFTIVRQPEATVHAGRPYIERYDAR